MPYVDRHRREAAFSQPESAGELNYCLTQHALDYLSRKTLSYGTLNEIVGAFEAAKAEFYARVVRPYEDGARARNGEVYPDVRPRTVPAPKRIRGRKLVAHWSEADFDA